MTERQAPKIITQHVYPPIPTRSEDWCAYYEGEEEAGNCGWGSTEAEAIADFVENCKDDHDERLGITVSVETDTLLPCPFCGCPDVVIFYDHPESVGPIVGGGHYISHPLWSNYPDTWRCDATPNRGYFGSKQEAIAAWNRRAPVAA